MREGTEVGYTLLYTLQFGYYLDRYNRILCQYRFQGAYRSSFIFNNYSIHTDN